MPICSSGLFIGVDYYDSYQPEYALDRARTDALRMYEYFRCANPKGKWECLIEDATRRPLRVDVLDGVHRLASSMKEGVAGVFYFAGHGFRTESGLVLLTADSRPTLEVDSGVPLNRVFQILQTGEARYGHFLLILDCCRGGVAKAMAEQIPNNVIVFFGCCGVTDAIESKSGGMLTSAILSSLEKIASRQTIGNLISTAEHVHKELLTTMRRVPEFFKLQPEIQGVCASKIYLPLVKTLQSRSIASARNPICYLQSFNSTPEEIKQLADGLRKEIAVLMSSGGVERITRQQVKLSNSHHLRVILPESPSFLEYILHRFPDAFSGLIVKWAGAIGLGRIRQATSHLSEGRWEHFPQDGLYSFSWMNRDLMGETSGQIWLDTTTRHRATLRITCPTPEGEFLGLYRLMPSLLVVYEMISRVVVKEE